LVSGDASVTSSSSMTTTTAPRSEGERPLSRTDP
jgi:hypothetical protein